MCRCRKFDCPRNICRKIAGCLCRNFAGSFQTAICRNFAYASSGEPLCDQLPLVFQRCLTVVTNSRTGTLFWQKPFCWKIHKRRRGEGKEPIFFPREAKRGVAFTEAPKWRRVATFKRGIRDGDSLSKIPFSSPYCSQGRKSSLTLLLLPPL